MEKYEVQIVDATALNLINGPFWVRVVRGENVRHVVAGTSGIATRERAEAIAADYRAQFGVAQSLLSRRV